MSPRAPSAEPGSPMPMFKKIFIGILFLIPAALVAAILVLILVGIDYGPDPGLEVGITLWGTWALLCGYYFKSSRFKTAGVVLLVFVVIGLLVNEPSPDVSLGSSLNGAPSISPSSQESQASSSELNDVLLQTANEINKRLPMMIDSDTRLDSTMALSNKFQYNYTIVSFSSQEIESEALMQEFEPRVINQACTLEDDLSFINVGVTMDYVYRANDGIRIGTISVSPEKCGL